MVSTRETRACPKTVSRLKPNQRAALRRWALALPGVTEEPHFHYGSWRVHSRIFVTLPPEGTHWHLFVAEPEREQALAMYPAWCEKLLWGGKVVGLRVALEPAEASALKPLVQQAYQHKFAAQSARKKKTPR